DAVVVKVPFSFIAGSEEMPAGNYVITQRSNDLAVVSIVSADGKHTAQVLTNAGSDDESGKPSLVFEQFRGHHFLPQVVPSGTESRDVPLSPALMQRELQAAGD